MDKTVQNAQEVSISSVGKYNFQEKDLKIIYHSQRDFVQLANFFSIMNDFKKGVPRTAYKGIVTFRYKHNRIFLVPSVPNLTYDKA